MSQKRGTGSRPPSTAASSKAKKDERVRWSDMLDPMSCCSVLSLLIVLAMTSSVIGMMSLARSIRAG